MTTDAPLGPRVFARLLDVGFSLVLTFALAVPLTVLYLVYAAVLGPSPVLISVFVGLAYTVAYGLLEWVVLVRRGGQSLGKGLLGLAVVADQAGAVLSSSQALIRLVVLFAPFALMIAASNQASELLDVLSVVGAFATVGSLILAATSAHRAIHDRAALSRVVVAERRPISWRADAALFLPGRSDLPHEP